MGRSSTYFWLNCTSMSARSVCSCGMSPRHLHRLRHFATLPAQRPTSPTSPPSQCLRHRVALETRGLHRHLIIVRNQMGHRVVAALIRSRFERGAFAQTTSPSLLRPPQRCLAHRLPSRSRCRIPLVPRPCTSHRFKHKQITTQQPPKPIALPFHPSSAFASVLESYSDSHHCPHKHTYLDL